jgi:hypothetical protein
MRQGEKKIHRWDFRFEGRVFSVDVYLLTRAKTSFRAVNRELNLRIENKDIDELRRLTAEFIEPAAKTDWSRWICYEVKYQPADGDSPNDKVALEINWEVIERTLIGTDDERYRPAGIDGKHSNHRIEKGAPQEGYMPSYRGDAPESAFAGVIPYSPEAIDGLRAIAAGIALLYTRLTVVLLPSKGTDIAKWLSDAGRAGLPMLPGSETSKAPRGQKVS